MRIFLLTLLSFCMLPAMNAQVSFTVTAPSSIAGGYDFTSNGDGTDWGLPNLDDPNDAVMDTLVLVDDGTSGINAQGIPFANEGCNALTPGSLTGKIALVYRYDGVSSNVCWYGTKVLNAQNAGAIGVVMINRDDALINVPGTTDGPFTNIPFAFISKSDGAILRARMDAGEDVVAFIGNKTGLFANDLGISKERTVAPKISATASQLTQNASEFSFDLGTMISNYGSTTQNDINVTVDVTGPGAPWSETAGPFTMQSGDTLNVFTGGTNTIGPFSLSNYPEGKYTLTYTVTQANPDESDFDNSIRYDFIISDSIIAYCSLDSLTNMPISNVNYRPAGAPVSFEACIAFRDPNASRLGAEGLYFSNVTGYNSGVTLDGEEIALTLYQWDDNFTDLNDPNLAFNDLNAVAYGFYYYPSDLQATTVYGSFSDPVQLLDNQRYLACMKVNNTEIYVGHDTKIDYTESINGTLQPISPNNSDNGFFALGFGTDLTPSIGLKVFDASEVSLSELSNEKLRLYPNPTNDFLTLSFNASMTGEILIYDVQGKLVGQKSIQHKALKTIDVSDLSPGIYTIEAEGDSNVRAKFVKQ